MDKWDKAFMNGQSEICGRQPLKHLHHITFLEAVFHKFQLLTLNIFHTLF